MLKTSFRALVVVTAFAVPSISFGANLASAVSTVLPTVSQLDPGAPSPTPVFNPKTKGTLDPGAPSPTPVFNPKGKK